MNGILKVLMLFLCGMVLSHEVAGQYFMWGQDPGSLKWRQILTPNFRIMFPEDFGEQAAYIADLLEYTHEHGGATLGHVPRRVPVILHHHTVVSNGFVGWAPARLEMFTTPPQDLDGHDWVESLAVHEFRHVVQLGKLNQGMTRALGYLLGEQATGLVAGLYLPFWFLEGDAVAVETGLTFGGRGRLPSFEQGLRAQVLERGIYSFDKATLGSLKDHVPDHYELGYQLVAHARARHGADVWEKVIDNVARKPYSLTPFNKGLKSSAGLSKKGLYRQAMEQLETKWRQHDSLQTPGQPSLVNSPQRLYVNYRYPMFINDSTLVALKRSLGDIPRVVSVVPGGREKVLFTPGILNAHPISTNGRLVVWSEQRTDPRWEHRSWSEIYRFDLQTGHRQRLTSRSRYFAPALSPDGSKIAAIEVSLNNEYALVVLDAETGEVIVRHASPGNDFLMTPAWSPDGHTLAAVALNEDGKRIVLTGVDSGAMTTVFHAGHTEISRPRFVEPGSLIFNGAFSGIDNIYVLRLASGEVRQLVASRFGAVDADLSPDGTTLVWSDYSSAGYGIATGAYDPAGIVPLDAVEDHSPGLHRTLAVQEGAVITRSSIPRKEYLSLPYNKFAGLFNFHSWAPFSVDADNLEGNPGLSVMSQSPLSTSVLVMGYEHDLLEERGKLFADLRYLGLYPVLNIRAESGMRESFYRDSNGRRVDFPWRENLLKLGASLPLTFQRGACNMGLQPSLSMNITRVMRTSGSPSFFKRNAYNSLEYRLFAYGQRRMVERDLRTPLGLVADLSYRHTPFEGGDMGSMLAMRAIVSLPGLVRHHSLRLSAGWQQRNAGEELPQTINYSYTNAITYPRGITQRNDNRATVLTAEYALPLFYPDWRIGPVIYLKRFSMNVFYDHAEVDFTHSQDDKEPENRSETLHSYGIDLMSQLHILRIFAPINAGIRVMFPSSHDAPALQFLWSVNL